MAQVNGSRGIGLGHRAAHVERRSRQGQRLISPWVDAQEHPSLVAPERCSDQGALPLADPLAAMDLFCLAARLQIRQWHRSPVPCPRLTLSTGLPRRSCHVCGLTLVSSYHHLCNSETLII